MADLHKFSVQEAVNTDTSGKWDVGSVTTVSSTSIDAIHGTDAKDISGYHVVGITINKDIHIRFSSTPAAAVAVATDILLAAGTHFIKIPHGVGNTIYLNMIAAGDDSTAKIVLI